MPFFKNISLEVSGNDFNLTTNVNKEKVKFQIPNPKSKIPRSRRNQYLLFYHLPKSLTKLSINTLNYHTH